VILFTAGCATYRDSMRPVLDRLAGGDAASALARLEEDRKDGDALWHLEHGLLLRLSGRWSESRAAFDQAEGISEDLYTRSLSREAAALATTDRLQPYRPPYHERLLARFYATLDEVEAGNLEGAAVEARRMEHLIDLERDRDEEAGCAVDPLATLLAAVVFEAAGEPNAALVSYRRHLLFSRDSGLDELAPGVRSRARRLAARLGIPLAQSELGDPPEAAGDSLEGPPSSMPPLVLVIVEQGLVRPRGEARLDVPILEEEKNHDREWLGPRLRSRCLEIREGRWDASDLRIAYWLALALPTYPEPIPLPEPPIVSAGGSPVALTPVLDLEEEARRRLEEDYGAILLRSVVRALVKWSVQRGVEDKAGELAGVLANALGAATEAAETRSWLSLPRVIRVGWVESPADTVLTELEFDENETVTTLGPANSRIRLAIRRDLP
jgi:hypothetical protein